MTRRQMQGANRRAWGRSPAAHAPVTPRAGRGDAAGLLAGNAESACQVEARLPHELDEQPQLPVREQPHVDLGLASHAVEGQPDGGAGFDLPVVVEMSALAASLSLRCAGTPAVPSQPSPPSFWSGLSRSTSRAVQCAVDAGTGSRRPPNRSLHGRSFSISACAPSLHGSRPHAPSRRFGPPEFDPVSGPFPCRRPPERAPARGRTATERRRSIGPPPARPFPAAAATMGSLDVLQPPARSGGSPPSHFLPVPCPDRAARARSS